MSEKNKIKSKIKLKILKGISFRFAILCGIFGETQPKMIEMGVPWLHRPKTSRDSNSHRQNFWSNKLAQFSEYSAYLFWSMR